ncbi:MAG: hypothetical protein K9L02_07280 [Acholeplasmataceae bacterium]|nr:hypothetical protein [Acholeplasmataceae bacterium]
MIRRYVFEIFIILLTVFLLVVSSIYSYYRWILNDGQYWNIFIYYIPSIFGFLSFFLFIELYIRKIKKTSSMDKLKLAYWYLPMTISFYFITTCFDIFSDTSNINVLGIFVIIIIVIVMFSMSIIFYRLRNRNFPLSKWIIYFACYFLCSSLIYSLGYLFSIAAGIGSLN